MADADAVAAKPPAPGSLAACVLLYKGFDTCCAYEPQSGSWTFSNQPCWGANQCMIDVDCPAGYVEMKSIEGKCT